MSILSVDQISPIGSGTTITLNATEVKTGTEITVGTGASIFSPAGNTLTLGTNNVERIRIKNDGKVGIATDTGNGLINTRHAGTNQQVLHVRADLGSSNGRSINLYTPDTDNSTAPFRFQTGNGYLFQCDSENVFTIAHDRTIGIGTANPTFAAGGGVHLQGGNQFTSYKVSAHTNTGVDFAQDASGNAYVYNRDNADLLLGTNNTQRVRINNSGAIGLGGANYGSSGQVLTSQGSGSAVQWATPAVAGGNIFIAKMSSGYVTSNNTDGEIVFQNEVYDPDSRYNNSNGRFTPNVAGYYFIDASLQFSLNSGNNLFESTIWKNGNEQFKNRMWNDGSNSDVHCKVTGIVTVNGSSDYISIAAWQNSGGNITVNPGNGSYFMGYFLRSL